MAALTPTPAQEVESVSGMTGGRFVVSFKNKTPVKLVEVFQEWIFLKRLWSADYLKLALGHKSEYLQVFVSHDNLTFIDNDAVTAKVLLSVNSFVDYVMDEKTNKPSAKQATEKQNFTRERKRYYLRTYSMPKIVYEDVSSKTMVKDLMYAINNDEQVREGRLESFKDQVFNKNTMQLWLGSSGNVTPLHYDRNHGLLFQIKGRKEIILFSHEDTKNLYPYPSFSDRSHISRINLRNLNEDLFPKFRRAQPFHCVLNEGELLYIPPFWWHDVTSLDNCLSVTFPWDISSNNEIPVSMLR